MNPNREEALFVLALEKPAEKRAQPSVYGYATVSSAFRSADLGSVSVVMR